MRVMTVDGAVVVPYATGKDPFVFATLREHRPLGHRARIREEPEASPRSLAREELGLPEAVEGEDLELLQSTAVYLLGELAWLHGVPEGAEVRLSPRGSMVVRVSADHLDWHREDARAWAKKQRRQGFLPVLVTRGDRVRILGIPWHGARKRGVVDLDEVRLRLPEHGVTAFDHVEVL